jgi:bifunctional ADP-heptose synthase (sugar kinase/adenylyltransferase)
MTPETLNTVITAFLQQASQKLEQAVQIAKAAVGLVVCRLSSVARSERLPRVSIVISKFSAGQVVRAADSTFSFLVSR